MKILYRILQFILKWVAKILPWKQPIVLEGQQSLIELKKHLSTLPYKHYLLVTDAGIKKAGLLDHVIKSIQLETIQITVFDETTPNPTLT